MKNIKRIGILALICILLFSIMTVGVCAAAQPNDPQTDTDASDTPLYEIEGEDMKMSERLEYALQGTVTGLVMVFAVLALLAVVVTLSKVVLYDLPRKAKERAAAKAKAEAEKEEKTVAQAEPVVAPVVPAAQADDGQLVAVITAAVAAAIASGDYGSEFASGFRVVSFNRVNTGTWNKR